MWFALAHYHELLSGLLATGDHQYTRVISVYSLLLYKQRESYILSLGEGNGTPLQYSCLGSPMDGGVW